MYQAYFLNFIMFIELVGEFVEAFNCFFEKRMLRHGIIAFDIFACFLAGFCDSVANVFKVDVML